MKSERKFSIIYENNKYFESNSAMFNMLVQFLADGRKWKSLNEKQEYVQLKKWIDDSIPLLDKPQYTLKTKAYWILNGLDSFPTCKRCKKTYDCINIDSLNDGYPTFCSHSCAANDQSTKEKAKKTCLERYGTASPSQNEAMKQKAKKTCLEKYGTEYAFQAKEVREKAKKTMLQRYGAEIPAQCNEIMQKIKQTKIQQYGNDQPWHKPEAYEARKAHWKVKYGVDHPCKTAAVQKKIKCTTMKRHGYECAFNEMPYQQARLHKLFSIYIENCEYDSPLFTFADFLKFNKHEHEFEFKCKKCGKTFKSKHINGMHSRCADCYPPEQSNGTSQSEKDIVAFLKQNIPDITIEVHNRTLIAPNEIDIYIPSKKLAIEFDGLFWHSDTYKSKDYHLQKTEQCLKKGIQLVHVFENEWLYKKAIVQSRLANMLGIYSKTVYARQCKTIALSANESNAFQEDNHLQGAVNAKVNLGLYDGNELVALMTFGKCRFDKKHEWEMLRFCCKLGYHVVGGAGKLLKHFERTYKPKSLVSYADRRWSNGKLYKALGFTLARISKPSYSYFTSKDHVLMSRIMFQKHKQKKLLKHFDESLTEAENMKKNGYHRIFDCGNLVFIKEYA